MRLSASSYIARRDIFIYPGNPFAQVECMRVRFNTSLFKYVIFDWQWSLTVSMRNWQIIEEINLTRRAEITGYKCRSFFGHKELDYFNWREILFDCNDYRNFCNYNNLEIFFLAFSFLSIYIYVLEILHYPNIRCYVVRIILFVNKLQCFFINWIL